MTFTRGAVRHVVPILSCMLIMYGPMVSSVFAEETSVPDSTICYAAVLRGKGVNLRLAPDFKTPHDGTQGKNGEVLPVVSVPQKEAWAKITEGPHRDRYVHLSVARIRFLHERAPCVHANGPAEVTGSPVNVRNAPSLQAEIAAQV